MAKMLREFDSTERHVNVGKRHIRLCRQVKGADVFADRLKPALENLQAKKNALAEKIELREMAMDDMILKDHILDDEIKSLFERGKIFDRENPNNRVLPIIFPSGRFTDITKLPRNEERIASEEIIIRLGNLGESHEMFECSAPLQAAINAMQTTIDAFNQTVIAEKQAHTEEDLAKANLRRHYEVNYLDLRKEFGREYAERFFPGIGKSRKSQTTAPAA